MPSDTSISVEGEDITNVLAGIDMGTAELAWHASWDMTAYSVIIT